MIWHDKTWVKTDTKLADDRVSNTLVTIFVILNGFNESLWPRLSNCAKVLHDFIAIHADSRIENCNWALFWVGGQAYIKFISCRLDRLFATLYHKSSLFKCIRAVGQKLTNKDLLVRIDRLCYDVKELSGFCLEFTLLGARQYRGLWLRIDLYLHCLAVRVRWKASD